MSVAEVEARCLADACASVKKQAFYMNKAIEGDNLKDALRYAALLLGELRTGELQPQRYFELYMQVFDHMALLQSWFQEQSSKLNSLSELYERVQWAGNVLPRLYLLCTVGACYIRSKQAPAKDILRDMVEMCKGVQHPIRGLFLRAYLCQTVRGLLPDVGSGYDTPTGGTTTDAIEFLLQNFAEMNKLWVRMQHQGSARSAAERKARDAERQQLADLVGKNLTYLSQLDGLDFDTYRGLVLPRVLEQVVGCRDDIAQQYLMQALIQGFSDEFHLGTLEALLGAVPQLQPGVRLAALMASLMERLARFVAAGAPTLQQSGRDSAAAFAALRASAAKVAKAHPDMAVAEVAMLHIGLARFAEAVFPEDALRHIDGVLGACADALTERGVREARGEARVVELLMVPVEAFDLSAVLRVQSFPRLMALLPPDAYRDMAAGLVRSALKRGVEVSTVAEVELLLDFIRPLVQDVDGATAEPCEDLDDEQSQMARLVHLLHSPDPAEHFAILQTARTRFKEGGPLRAAHVLPPLAAACLRLVRDITSSAGGAPAAGPSVEEVLQFLHAVLVELSDIPGQTQAALGLLLVAAVAASQEARADLIAYDFFEQAFLLYEEQVPDTRAEVAALHDIVGALQACRVFDDDSRGALAHKATGFSAKLLKRGDQCRAVLACSHLYWQPEDAPPTHSGEEGGEDAGNDAPQPADSGRQPPVRDSTAVLVLLKRALKLASSAQQQAARTARAGGLSAPVWLYVDILNEYAFYLREGASDISPTTLHDVLELVEGEVASDACQKDGPLLQYFTSSAAAAKALIEK